MLLFFLSWTFKENQLFTHYDDVQTQIVTQHSKLRSILEEANLSLKSTIVAPVLPPLPYPIEDDDDDEEGPEG